LCASSIVITETLALIDLRELNCPADPEDEEVLGVPNKYSGVQNAKLGTLLLQTPYYNS